MITFKEFITERFSPEYYEKLASYHDRDANLQNINDNAKQHAIKMAKRAREAGQLLKSKKMGAEKAWKYYQSGNVNEEFLEESKQTITTVDGPKAIRPGTKHAYEVVKEHDSYTHPVTKEEHRVFSVKRPNGFHGYLVTNKDKSMVITTNHKNLNKEEAHKAAEHYSKNGLVGMKDYYLTAEKIVEEFLSESKQHKAGTVGILVNPHGTGLKRYTVYFKPDAKSVLGRTKSVYITHHDDLEEAKGAKAEYVAKYKDHGVRALK